MQMASKDWFLLLMSWVYPGQLYKERRLSFSTKSPFSLLAEGDQRLKWRCLLDKVRTFYNVAPPRTTRCRSSAGLLGD